MAQNQLVLNVVQIRFSHGHGEKTGVSLYYDIPTLVLTVPRWMDPEVVKYCKPGIFHGRNGECESFVGLQSPPYGNCVWGAEGRVRYLSDAQLFMWLDTSGERGLVGFLAALLAVILLASIGTAYVLSGGLNQSIQLVIGDFEDIFKENLPPYIDFSRPPSHPEAQPATPSWPHSFVSDL
ncbi:hypothetical protein DFP73DRAFT_77891 [Morchella snyderi]|nr:hypothetical protein DFP73DRAFT_77891 [Morchella snyderi]